MLLRTLKQYIIAACLLSVSFERICAQVNLQTGSATFSLPMFNWQDDGSHLNSAVSLDYNSGNGLKVNDIASNVGQGWNLNAGGVITRIQVGQPDDQMPKDGTYDDVTKYPAGYLYNPGAGNLGCPKELANYPLFGGPNQVYKQHNVLTADREQDYFSFQFNGRSGVFVISNSNGGSGVMLGNNKVKIWFTQNAAMAAQLNSRTTIMAFYIQDENGIIYTFSQLGMTKVLHTYPTNPLTGGTLPTMPTYVDKGVYYETDVDDIPSFSNPYVISSWYLTQVKDPLTNRQITYNYTIRNINTPAGDDISSYGSDATTPRYVVITHHISASQTPALTSVQYPDGNTITFNYDNLNPRFDLNGDYPLKSVDVSYNGRAVSSYLLNTTYFILNSYGTPSKADIPNARLCLKSVTKFGVDLKENYPPYVFDYYTGSSAPGDFVPPPLYYFKDIWGYYDGGNANNLLNQQTTAVIPFSNVQLYNLSSAQLNALCFINNNSPAIGTAISALSYNTINPKFAENGLLKSITFPEGGSLAYTYDQNMCGNFEPSGDYLTYNSIYSGGVHVSTTSKTDGGYSNNNSKAIVSTYNYVTEGGLTSQWGLECPYNGITSSYQYTPGGARQTIFNGCKYDYTYMGIPSLEQSQSVTDNINLAQVVLQIFSEVVEIAGIAKDIYDLAASGDPVGLIMDVISIVIDIVTECSENYSQNDDNYIFCNYNVYSSNPFPTKFGRVEVVSGPSGTSAIGKTVYEFTSNADYAFWDDGHPMIETENIEAYDPFSMKQRAAFWAYGLPKKITTYDAAGNILKQTENVYDYSNAKIPVSTDMSCNCYVEQSISMESPDWINLSNSQNLHYTLSSVTYPYPVDEPYTDAYNMKVDQYEMYTGRVELSDSYDRVFSPGGGASSTVFSEKHTHYDYNQNNFQVSKITTTQSNGDQNAKEIYYPVDYTASGILQSLVANNRVDVPVATFTSVIKANNSTPQYLGASINDFETVGNGDIKVSKSYTGRASSPITGFSFDPTNPFNYPGLVQTQSFLYGQTLGDLVGLADEGNHTITNIYDYNDKRVVASVINAQPFVDFPAYTSFETSNFGGWSLTGNTSYATTSAITGSRSFILDGNTLATASSLNTTKPYKLSFWSTGNVNISGGSTTLVTSTPTINGFTYHEYNIAAGASSISLSGTGNIDELRIYPKNARMRTVTYDEIIGKTSECDENNRVTYYGYDNLGRLSVIKDENGNIVKMYEYNLVQNGSISKATNIPNLIYAKLTLANVTGPDVNQNTWADIVVSFYLDPGCTQPLYLRNNVTVGYYFNTSCDNTIDLPPSLNNNVQVTISGAYSYTLTQQALISGPYTSQDQAGNQTSANCSYDYELAPGSGYIIVPGH